MSISNSFPSVGKVKSKGVDMKKHRVHSWGSNWKILATAEVDTVGDSLERLVGVTDKVRAPKDIHAQSLKSMNVTLCSKGTLQK